MIRTKLQRITCILLLVMVAILFSACSQVTVMTVSNEDGTIDEVVSVTLDRTTIAESSVNIDDIKADIEFSSVNEARQIVYQYNSRVQNDLMLNLDSEAQQTLGKFIDGIEVVGNTWQGDTYLIGIRFKNEAVYRYYYNITEDIEPTTETEEHLFYNKLTYQAYTMYMSYGDLYNRLKAYYTSHYPEFNLTDTELIYTYITESGRQHSDADYIVRSQGKYYHSWIVEDSGEVITFYYKIANRSNWILMCITVALVTTLVMVLIALIKNKLNKKYKNN